MIHVLMGLVGVAVIVGMVFASSSYIGNKFNFASSSTLAAAATSQVQQTQSAVEMWRIKMGQTTVYNQDTAFLRPRFLKSVANPMPGGQANPTNYFWQPHLNNDIYSDTHNEGGSVVARYVMMPLGAVGDTKALAVCTEIARIHHNSVIPTTGSPTGNVGCANNSSHYVVWTRIAP